MALGRRRFSGEMNYWPSFVDALTTLVLAVVFMLSVFMISQYFLSQEISGKDTVLNRLNAQIAELTALLAMERASGRDISDDLSQMQMSLADMEAERDRLRSQLAAQTGAGAAAGDAAAQLTSELTAERQVSQQALAQVELLNQQISALRRQIAALEDALDASESRDRESQTKIADLGKRLNVALAQKVQELSRYRSDFFGRLREILGNRSDIRVVGDRFVFQSEVLFGSGSEQVNDAGTGELDKLADALLELESEIPAEIAWVLRVDGHTDARPLSGTGRFRDNWELSAARAISVVKYLISRGVKPEHLVAAGFGEFQPLEAGEGDEVFAKNRRIELKLTER
ncbi:peptidoglycan -binding protein [Methylobrevis pamukkalensis]|uniref:Motility protein B n=1 Tax=Methylobrevis pamukkalensis TaxID=1439726 RepID=A0A1E3H157_9HYPH|nr:peptidoglycan -binding protein [Methylobrevis pamukkalensis]ODN70040.1 Motility protein B [Methylobrevis pamukkalensis]